MSWWDIKARDPFVVCADADSIAEAGTRDAIEGRKDGFGPFDDKQRDALAWTARWDAAGAYIMAGLTYRLLHEARRLWWAVIGLSALNTVLLILLLGAVL